MYFLLFIVLTYLLTCHCSNEKDDIICGLPRQWVESASVSMELNKKGFHRELVTTVQFSHGVPDGLKVLLVHRWPRGIYVDPYQLASQSDHSDLQILLDSTIDLEAPAHKTGGFAALVFPPLDGQNPTLLKAVVPIHGRYHKPSFLNEKEVFVNLEPPELLLRTDTLPSQVVVGSYFDLIEELQIARFASCSSLWKSVVIGGERMLISYARGAKLDHFQAHTIVDAPCTADNSSICHWLKTRHQQDQSHVSLLIPVGDGSLVKPVCAGTLLVTLICCVVLSRNIWKHGIF